MNFHVETYILLTSSKNQIYKFRIPNIFCCLNENLTTFLYTLSLTEATRKQSVYISRMLLKKIVVDIGDSEFVNLVFRWREQDNNFKFMNFHLFSVLTLQTKLAAMVVWSTTRVRLPIWWPRWLRMAKVHVCFWSPNMTLNLESSFYMTTVTDPKKALSFFHG